MAFLKIGLPENMTDFSPSSNTSTLTCEKSITNQTLHPADVIKFVGYWELVVAIIGTPANALVLFLTVGFMRRGSRGASSASRSERRHQSNLWFIFSMTLADFLFSCLHSPMMFAKYAFGVNIYNTPACFTVYLVTHTSTICSSISLLWLNLDKFLYLNQPLHYHARMTSRRALGAVVCAWMISLIWAVFFTLGPFVKYYYPCDYRPVHISWYTAFAVGFFVLPTAVSLMISVYIALVVLRVMRENEARRKSGSVRTVVSNGSSHSGSSSRKTSTVKSSTSAKAIAFVFTTTMWSAWTYLPYRIAYLIYLSFPQIHTKFLVGLFYVLFCLLATNAAGNPFITIITQRQYSMGFMKLIKKHTVEYSTYSETSCHVHRASQTRLASMQRCSVASKILDVKNDELVSRI